MTLGGMLKHLARFEDDMSTEWLHGREQLPPWNAVDWSADPTWDWRSAADDSPEQLYARWHDEMASAWLYRVLASAERDPAKTALFRKLTAAAEEQAGIIARDTA